MIKIKSKYNLISSFRSLSNSLPPTSFKYRHFSSNQNETAQKEFITFDRVNQQRHEQARRSVLVQVNSEKSFCGLEHYCSRIANIRSAHHYSVAASDSHFILLEFESIAEATALLEASAFNQDTPGVPAKSQFLWFRMGSSGKETVEPTQASKPLTTENGTSKSHNDLVELLHGASSLEEQMNIVYKNSRMTDLGTRLKFLAAQQLQNSIRGIFPRAVAHPFGSSVNGFGKVGCDLDLILRLGIESHEPQPDSRLIFQTKTNLHNGRSQAQIYMESIADILKLFLPGVNNVVRILHARVPIIKYKHEYLDLDVDLSMNSLTGAYMSELLYMFGQIDDRVRPLVFCIRQWAKSVNLTYASPGRWITNFSLTLLVLYFLQAHKSPVLPSINYLGQHARQEDTRITEDNIKCTFLRDINVMKFVTSNKSSVDQLLLEFFEFYSAFDFDKSAISLNEAKAIVKPEHSAMFIVNPIEPRMNVSKNVSLEEKERFAIEARNAAWLLSTDVAERKSLGEPWGLIRLFKLKTTTSNDKKPKMFSKQRMVNMSEIFEEPAGSTNKEIVFLNTNLKQNSVQVQRQRPMQRMKAKNVKR